MKKLFVILTMLAAMMMGAGAANATGEGVRYTDEASCTEAGFVWADAEGTTPFCFDSDRGGQITPTPQIPAGPKNGTTVPNDGGLTPELDPFEPAPSVSVEQAPVESYPAPPVVPNTAPVEVQPVPAPEPMPEGTEARVAAGEELAYTGAGMTIWGAVGAGALLVGFVLVALSRRRMG